jgi:hypothetical protein
MVQQGRMLMASPDIYDQLAKEPLSDLTITQLNAGSSVTSIDSATIDYWRGPITLARILESSRTYAGGTLPIPETGAVAVVPVGAAADADVQPTGSEIWVIKAIHATAAGGSATCTLSLTDGITAVPFKGTFSVATGAGTIIDVNDAVDGPLFLSNALYLNINESGGANPAQFSLAYYKMGL